MYTFHELNVLSLIQGKERGRGEGERGREERKRSGERRLID